MLVYVFPGQGSQSIGMGADLFTKFPDLIEQANNILGYAIDELCLQDSQQQLNQTQYTQPALYVVNALSYLDLLEKSNNQPDYLVGHSLGEYNALFAGGAFDFLTGLKLVQKRGELMSQASSGAMAAVIGLDAQQIVQVLNENNLQAIDIANYNSPIQTVISGLADDIQQANEYLKEAGARMVIPLKVSAAFHSRYMQSAQEQFAQFIAEFDFSELKIPVVSNVHALPYEVDQVKENLIQQITLSVRWVESIQYLLLKGDIEFQEVGPGNVLTGLIKQIKMA